jgi:hypothetical protein
LVVEIYRRDADQTSGLERSLYEHAGFASEADGLNEFDLAQGRAAKTEQSWLCTQFLVKWCAQRFGYAEACP